MVQLRVSYFRVVNLMQGLIEKGLLLSFAREKTTGLAEIWLALSLLLVSRFIRYHASVADLGLCGL